MNEFRFHLPDAKEELVREILQRRQKSFLSPVEQARLELLRAILALLYEAERRD